MMAGPGGESPAGGGPARHIPVLLREVLDALRPLDGQHFIDGTFGAGGYTTALLEEGASVTAIDRDPTAIEAGQGLVERWAGRLRLVENRFSRLDEVVEGQVDGVVLDIGVSSMQIDQAVRGFSFQKDGPLDMRMERSGLSAADVVNTMKAGDLARIAYGSSKAAIIGLTKYVATQHGRQNIRCNSIAPGVVLTEALEKTVPGLKEIIQRHILTPEFGTPDDIAALVAFLASDEARYITGENISISGGGLVHQPHYADLLAFMQAKD